MSVCLSVFIKRQNGRTDWTKKGVWVAKAELVDREKCQRFLLLKMHLKNEVFVANSDF